MKPLNISTPKRNGIRGMIGGYSSFKIIPMSSSIRAGSKIGSLMHLAVAAPYSLSWALKWLVLRKSKTLMSHVLIFENILTVLRDSLTHGVGDFLLQDGCLFRPRRLCIPCTSLREFLVWELHVGGLAGHFERNKTIETVEHCFYWSSLKRDVARLVGQYRMCQLAK